METILEFYDGFREQFPVITLKADKEHIKYWGELDRNFAYSWFESLAKAINSEMLKNIEYKKYESVFVYITCVLASCGKEVYNCIDVAFVENLFWQVSDKMAEPYWRALPKPLKELYVGFHHRAPVQVRW